MRNTNLSRLNHFTKQKTELEHFLEAFGWPWNEMLSRELDRIIQRMGARDEPSLN